MSSKKSFITQLERKLSRKIRNEEDVQTILSTGGELSEKISSQHKEIITGLLYGQVQSGKTNNMLSNMAIEIDNGRRLFVILTSDNVWLYDQTFERINTHLPGVLTIGKDELEQEVDPNRIRTSFEKSAVVLVATKNKDVLPKLNNFIHRMEIPERVMPIIYDDEADLASLNNRAQRDDEVRSTINTQIVELRDKFPSHVFIQITATPYALVLQNSESIFRPDFDLIFKPGQSYIGGDFFFEQEAENNSAVFTFPNKEVETLLTRESFTGLNLTTGLKQALCSFFVGGASRIILEEGEKHTFLCHISSLTDEHNTVKDKIDSFVSEMFAGINSPDSPEYKQCIVMLEETYVDLKNTKQKLPPFQDVLEEITHQINGTKVQLLTSSTSQKKPEYNSNFNILVGGNKLGRGVTIDNLIVTYYGRTTGAPKTDTILQHARMFGYRKDYSNVLRLYTSSEVFDTFKSAYESDKDLINMVSSGKDFEAYIINGSQTELGRLSPTRKNVLDVSLTKYYKAGQSYFPDFPLAVNVKELDERLLSRITTGMEAEEITIEEMMQLIKLTDSEDGHTLPWDKEAICYSLSSLKDKGYKTAKMVVRKDREISRGTGAMLGTRDNSNFKDLDMPVLFMYKYKDNPGEEHYDGKGERWNPNVRIPKGDRLRYYVFNKGIL